MTRTRRGFTLVELLAVVASMTVLLGVCVALVQALMKVERTGRNYVAEGSTFARLMHDFKRDAHAAVRVDPQSEAGKPMKEIAFLGPDGERATYRAFDAGVELIVAKSKDAVRQERFALSLYGRPEFEVEEVEGRKLVSLTFHGPAPVSKRESVPPLRIDAIVARDHGFAKEDAKP